LKMRADYIILLNMMKMFSATNLIKVFYTYVSNIFRGLT
jgi:hypothetical protein